MAKIGSQRRFAGRDEWRAWHHANHAVEKEMWLIFYKKHTGRAGLAKIESPKKDGQWNNAAVQKANPEVPPELPAALARNPAARRNFENLAPSYRRRFVYWIAMARREKTRRKRVAEVIGLLARNEKLSMK